MVAADTNLARLAVEAGLLTAAEAAAALPATQPLPHLTDSLRRKGLTEDQIALLLACDLGLPFVEVEGLQIDPAAVCRVPLELQIRYQVVPLRIERDGDCEMLYAGMLPERAAAIAIFLTQRLGITVVPVVASATSIRSHLDALLGKAQTHARPVTVFDVDLDTPATLDVWGQFLRAAAH